MLCVIISPAAKKRVKNGGVYMNKVIGFVGAGNMGGSIVYGAVSSGVISRENVLINSIDVSEKVKSLNINVTNLEELIKKSDYIILCIKPIGFEALLNEIKNIKGFESKVYISIAAGITIDYIKSILGDVKVIRTMPNLPLFAGGGMTVIAPDSKAEEDDISAAEEIFSASGKTLRISESNINAYTAVSGSGPAYAFMFIEALADGAVRCGIPRKEAYTVAAQTLYGSALMHLETGIHPAELKDMVCSPGGTTIDAVASLEADGFRNAVLNAVDACLKKAEKMKK